MSELPWQAALALYACEKPTPMGWPTAIVWLTAIIVICLTVAFCVWCNRGGRY